MKHSAAISRPADTPDVPSTYVERARADLLHPQILPTSQPQSHLGNNPPFPDPNETAAPSLFQGQSASQQQSHVMSAPILQSAFSAQTMHRFHQTANGHDVPSRASQSHFGTRQQMTNSAPLNAGNVSATSIINGAQQEQEDLKKRHASHHMENQPSSQRQQHQHQTTHHASQDTAQGGFPNCSQQQYSSFGNRINSARFDHHQHNTTRFEPPGLPSKYDRGLQTPQISQHLSSTRHFSTISPQYHSSRIGGASGLGGIHGNSGVGGGGGSNVGAGGGWDLSRTGLFDQHSAGVGGVDTSGSSHALASSGVPDHQHGGSGVTYGIAHGMGSMDIGSFKPGSPIRRFGGNSRGQRARARLNQLTDKQKKERHNAHTRSSRLRIDDGLKKLKEALTMVKPSLKLNKKADIVEEAYKFVMETYQTITLNHGGEPQDSSLSG